MSRGEPRQREARNRYFRDIEGREFGFVVTEKDQPALAGKRHFAESKCPAGPAFVFDRNEPLEMRCPGQR